MSMDDTQAYLGGVAIIGMSGRFPGAQSVSQFWQNLVNGRETITFFSKEELLAAGVAEELINHPDFVPAQGVLEGIEWFDASFFGFSPREAELLDPQQRLFLECVWESLEMAGYSPYDTEAIIGVFAGAPSSTYFLHNLLPNLEHLSSSGAWQIAIGNEKDHMPTRTSYKLNLRGPSVNVNTACSTSLVATHLACQSLLSYHCDMALAGGVTIKVPQHTGYLYQEGWIASPDGHTRAFDKNAQGSGFGNGVGVVLLKRLEDAIADRDLIYAVIKGSSINNDGSSRVGYTAPSVEGQIEVIATAQAVAQVEPRTIDYIETHGTGTALGDPIEASALIRVFEENTDEKQFCALGSVKTNVGHLDSAAGMAGLIKTTMALHHKQIPATLHFQEPNQQIPLADSPFYINTELMEWKSSEGPRRAGISSFGIGGTNAHLILEEAPPREKTGSFRPHQLILLSAKTKDALEQMTDRLIRHMEEQPQQSLAEIAYTLQTGRTHFSHRRMLVCQTAKEARERLALRDARRVLSGEMSGTNKEVAFLFPGLGEQYVNMTLGLYGQEHVFTQEIDHCSELLKPHLGEDLRNILFQPQQQKEVETSEPGRFDLRKLLGRSQEGNDPAQELLNRTKYAHPTLFVLEYALAQQWMAWGIKPAAMVGYSIGEYTAACLSGVISKEDALYLIAKRAELIETLPPGAMLGVPMSADELIELLKPGLSLAADNAPDLSVAAGPVHLIAALEAELAMREIPTRRLQTTHAFHSAMMEPLRDAFQSMVAGIRLHPPQIPYVSTVTGTWITPDEATDPRYWSEHMCKPVRFGKAVRSLHEAFPGQVWLEVGPGHSLGNLVMHNEEALSGERPAVIPTVRHLYDLSSDAEFLLQSIGKLWLEGVRFDWHHYWGEDKPYRASLPTYPFERERYWVDPVVAREEKNATTVDVRLAVKDWFSYPIWEQNVQPERLPLEKQASGKTRWLFFANESFVSRHVHTVLRQEDSEAEVFTIFAGTDYKQAGPYEFTIEPDNPTHYEMLVKALHSGSSPFPSRIVHAWHVDHDEESNEEITWPHAFWQQQRLGFRSLLSLTQAMSRQHVDQNCMISVITSGLSDVTGDEILVPEKSTLLALLKVIPQEYRNMTCRHIDIPVALANKRGTERLLAQLTEEILYPSVDPTVALRGARRYRQTYEAVSLPKSDTTPAILRQGGVYLITGGLGRLGMLFADYLAQQVQAKLVLTGRTILSALENEDNRGCEGDQSRRAIIEKWQSIGGEVLMLQADVASLEQMRAAVAQAIHRFGRIDGVIHTAGIMGEAAHADILDTDEEMIQKNFLPKVQGFYVLQDALKDVPLDFTLYLSSLSATLGGLGASAYAAAHTFLDYAARNSGHAKSSPVISVDWDGAATDAETLDAIDRIFAAKSHEVPLIVSTRRLSDMVKKWLTSAPDPLHSEKQSISTGSSYARPHLKNAYVAPQTELEQLIAAIWSPLLGIEQIGVHDRFFDLGGDSLIGTQLISRLRATFEIDLTLRMLFEIPTVAEQAALIEEILLSKVEALDETIVSSMETEYMKN
ncbi:SDR family oxidoreductase [Brevibacillus panacihumi]|uniref:type I polyketide synthase n=1 Tax=Brevibacillus panacihumi TaxID=497735 RepID=UPI003D1E034B